MSGTKTIFLPKTRYRELVALATWYCSTPPDLFELFGDAMLETVNQNLGELALGPWYGDAQVEDADWLEGWAVRRGTVYADHLPSGRRVRFAPVHAKTREGRRYRTKWPDTTVGRLLEDGGPEL